MEKTSRQQLVIASRESRLALWQAQHVSAIIAQLYPHCAIDILGMTTRGDRILDRALSSVGGKGLFVKELEIALEDGRADLAVHSLKDVPLELPQGFELAAVLEREDPRDAFVSNVHDSLDAMPEGSVVGTSSLRRQASIAIRYPHLVVHPLRGNVDTRLAKLDSGEYAAIILAAAGLKRLGMRQRIKMFIEPEMMLPAAGQGALAIEIRSGRDDLRALLAPLDHHETALAVMAERTVTAALGGSCQMPLAAHATLDGSQMHLRAMVATPDGKRFAYAESSGIASQPQALGESVAQLLLARGASAILGFCGTTADG